MKVKAVATRLLLLLGNSHNSNINISSSSPKPDRKLNHTQPIQRRNRQISRPERLLLQRSLQRVQRHLRNRPVVRTITASSIIITINSSSPLLPTVVRSEDGVDEVVDVAVFDGTITLPLLTWGDHDQHLSMWIWKLSNSIFYSKCKCIKKLPDRYLHVLIALLVSTTLASIICAKISFCAVRRVIYCQEEISIYAS